MNKWEERNLVRCIDDSCVIPVESEHYHYDGDVTNPAVNMLDMEDFDRFMEMLDEPIDLDRVESLKELFDRPSPFRDDNEATKET